MSKQEIDNMTKKEMVAALVQIGVAKFGEVERAGYQSMYQKKSPAELRCDLALASGIKGRMKGETCISLAEAERRGIS